MPRYAAIIACLLMPYAAYADCRYAADAAAVTLRYASFLTLMPLP